MKRHASPFDPAPPVHARHRRMAGVLAGSIVLVVGACAVTAASSKTSMQAIERCMSDMLSRTGRALSSEADRAYVYARGETYWIYFTHGDSGTFGRRSEDYHIVLTCGIVRGTSSGLVFLGEPMEDPIFDSPDREDFVTPAGSTELLFKRADGRFDYCCSQPFNRANVYR